MGRGKSKVVYRMPNYKKAVIARNKLKNYLLNPTKSNGKSAFFNSLGYNMKNFRRFRSDILKGISENEAVETITNKYGHKVKVYNISMQLGINKKAIVLTSWQKDSDNTSPRLITAYPDKRRKKT